jgi:hypothetical protein
VSSPPHDPAAVPSPPDARLDFSDDVPNASLANTDTFSASAPT